MNVTPLNRRFVGFIANHPVVAILLALGLVVGLASGMKHLRADYTQNGFFWGDDPKLAAFNAFERRFGNDDAILLAVHSPSGIFDMESASLIQRLTEQMWQVPEVIRVESLANFNWVHSHGDDIVVEPLFPARLTPSVLAERQRVALTHESIPNYLVDRAGTVTVVMGRLRPGFDKAPDAAVVTRAVRALADRAKGGDHRFYISGGPAINYAFEEITTTDVQRLVPIALGLAALFLSLLLRNLAGVLLPFVVVISAVVAAFGFAGWTGLVQTATSSIVPSILIATGIADTVHILVVFLEELRRGRSRREAAHYSLTKNLLPTFLTCLTTAVGLFSFVSANLKLIAIMGIMAGVGTVVAWLVAQLLVGGLLFLLPIKARPVPAERHERAEQRARRFVNAIARRRRPIIAGTVVFSVVSLVIAMRLDVDSDPIKYFRKQSPVRVANEFMEATMGNARSFELVVDAGVEDGIKDPAFLSRVDEFQQWIEKQPRITRAVSIVDVLKSTHRSLAGDDPRAYRLAEDRQTIAQELLLYTMGLPQGMDVNDRVTVKHDALRLTVLNTLVTARQAVAAVESIVAHGKALGLQVQATGKYYLFQEMNEYVVQSFLSSLWLAAGLVGLIMALFLRSLKLGLISMAPNVVPLFAGGALLQLLGQPLDIGTVLIASVCLGISIDDTSHVLANFVYLRRNGYGPREAMQQVMSRTGPSLLSTNTVLITSFASFAMATFVPNIYFGVLTAFILTVALVADLLFTPAVLLSDPLWKG